MRAHLIGKAHLKAVGHFMAPTVSVFHKTEDIQTVHQGKRTTAGVTLIHREPQASASFTSRSLKTELGTRKNDVQIDKKSVTIDVSVEEHSEEWVYGD